ncbi:MAG TPA: gas vesicle protein [Candidatus Nitrosotalea sp.]|nr:gas vesicle protein [Candidatus Nitrosotalea sp.]
MSSRQLTQQQLTIVDLVDRILDKGVVITGDITVSIVGVDLLSLKINLVIASLETAKRYGIKLPWEKLEKVQPKKAPAKTLKR